MANYYGDMGIGNLSSGLDSIINAFQGMAQQRQLAQLGDQIKSGDLMGAANSAISRGNLDLGLKLYQLHRQTADEAGLGEKLQNILSPTPAAAPLQTGRSAVVPTAAADTTGAMAYAPAVAGGETSATNPNAYSTTGITIPKTGDRAYGKYQVMGANVGPWTKEVLGQEMSPQEFLANPDAQDAVFKGKFGQYVQKYGPDGAARAWFAGERGMNNPNATDPLGTTVSSYASGFNRRLGQPPAQQAISDAMGRAPDGTPIVPAGQRTLGPPPAASALGQPPDKEEDPDVTALIQKRNQLITLMPQAKGTKYETTIPAAVQTLNDQIKYLRDTKDEPSKVADRLRLAPGLGLQPGTPEWQNYVAGRDVVEKAPARQVIKNPDGSETVMVFDRSADGWKPMEGVPKPPVDPNVPAGVDPKEYAKKKADEAVKLDQATEESKKTAEQVGPIIDDAKRAYEELNKNGAIGPTQALGPVRHVEAMLGNKNEILRQRYEMAISKLQLLQSRIYMKGQGAVSDFERRLIGSTFPSLGAASGQIGLDSLDSMKTQLDSASHKIAPAPAAKPAPVTRNGYTIEEVHH